MRSTTSAAPLPKWTKYVVTDSGGRDPLGLSRVSFMVADHLLNGITTTTWRARYYSFHAWALWHVETSESPKSEGAFAEAFRKREAFFALATLQSNPDAVSVVGVRVVRPRLQRYKESNEVDTNFQVLPSSRMGSYGQAYGGSLYALGLTHRTDDGIDRVAAGRGEALARAFHRTAAETAYCKKEHFRHNLIPFGVLEESAESISLDSLGRQEAAEERERLRDLLFGWDRPVASEHDLLRRQTLGLILYTVSEYGRVGFAPTADGFEDYLVYGPYYYGVMWRDDEPPLPYEPPAIFSACRGLWQQFCAHEFLTRALETLLCCVLDVVNAHPSGIGLEDVCSSLVGGAFLATLDKVFGGGTTPKDLMASLGMEAVPSEDSYRDSKTSIDPTSGKSEWALTDRAGELPQEMAAVAVGLLAVLYSRWRGVQNESARYVAIKAGPNLRMGVVLETLDAWFSTDIGWQQALSKLVEAFVLVPHDRVMFERGSLENCWLRRLESKLYKNQDYQPFFRSSRHGNCVWILHDIGLLELGPDNTISITTSGNEQLRRILDTDGAPK